MPLIDTLEPEPRIRSFTILHAVGGAVDRAGEVDQALRPLLRARRPSHMGDDRDRAIEHLAYPVAALNRRTNRVRIAIMTATGRQHACPGVEPHRDVRMVPELPQ